jgi:Cof subfamily protein (haloacid dehalogenase superfamily)
MSAPERYKHHAHIHLLALDLDGTLFGDDLVISPRVREAIRDAQGVGVTVVIATGRMFRSARQIAADLEISGPIICYQGAMVADTRTGEVLLHRTIPFDHALSVIDETKRMGLHLNLYMDDELYVEARNPQAEFYAHINMGLPMNEVGDLRNWLNARGGKEPTKLVIVTDAPQTDPTLAYFTEQYGEALQVTKSHPRFTEFTNRLSSKGDALRFLAEMLGIERDSVMAIGDGLNDLSMISWAGLGVAMHACPLPLREAARVVCPPLAEDGAALAIREYVLGNSSET